MYNKPCYGNERKVDCTYFVDLIVVMLHKRSPPPVSDYTVPCRVMVYPEYAYSKGLRYFQSMQRCAKTARRGKWVDLGYKYRRNPTWGACPVLAGFSAGFRSRPACSRNRGCRCSPVQRP